jgi:purine-binding chemotaxis protein CheW
VNRVHVFVRLGAESYALPAAHVREVARCGTLAEIPGAGRHVLGIVNLRGRVVPVFDLAALLGAAREGPHAHVCVASHAAGLGGLAVDDVTDVAALPDGGEAADTELLARSAMVGDRLVGVVDMDALFAELERRGGT